MDMHHVLPIFLIISAMGYTIMGQSPQDSQQPSCSCPSNSGFPGPMGPPGVGVQGPQGLTGPAGDPGSNGIPGVPGTGIPGFKGEKGDMGQGSKGQSGEPGSKGDKGLDGVGLIGPRGHAGKVGPQGDKGEIGTSYTAPPMSAFSARKTTNRHISSGTEVITFEAEDLDVGNDFNPSTGVFTCRIQGLYYFSFSFRPDDDYLFQSFLEHNGSRKAAITTTKQDSRYITQSQSVILSLQVGDEVRLTAVAPSNIEVSSQLTNIFNGYLIHAT